MSKYQRQIERLMRKWAVPPTTTVEDLAKQARWPAGAPGSKGGQFAPEKGGAGGSSKGAGSGAVQYTSYGSLFGSGSTFPGGDSPKWAGEQNAKPMAPPPGAKPHLKPNDKGETVTVNYPSKPSDKASWADPDRTATFVPGGEVPAKLNGVAIKSWASVPKSEQEWANVPGQKLSLDARFPFEPMPGKSVGAGVIVREPDGRVWLTKPTNAFGGYQQTFPKGTVEHGLSMQASAIKETWEETGLQIRITGILGDYERTTSKARFYIAERVGGTPADMGWESQAVRLATRSDMDKLLNMGVDKGILEDLDMEGFFDKAAAKPKSNYNPNQPRWPQGTPLGGQWKTVDGSGLTMPPTLAGGLTGSNSQYQKKADAAYAAAKAGDKKLVLDTAIALEAKVKANAAKGAVSSHVKWSAQLSQYATQLASDLFAAPKVQAVAERLSSLTKLSGLTFLKPKSEGSNPGAHYTDANGQEWLVKGNAAASSTGPMTSDGRAKNEVLAAKLMQAAGVGAPDMKLVDLEGQHGGKKGGPGNLGVASKIMGGLSKFDPSNPAHIAAARADFAVHAWLGNWDVLGASYDNTMIGAGGKAVCIDPGGSIFFRAQGALKDKGAFDNTAADFETMRSSNHLQKQVYGGMTKSELADSAAKLAGVTDDTIRQIVKTAAPMASDEQNNQLADTLIARRDAILAKAGVAKAGTLAGAKDAPAIVAPAPVPAPPSVADANTPAKPVVGLAKPAYDDTFGKAGYYDKLSDQMLAAHAAGDMAMLQALTLKKDGVTKVWPEKGGAPSTVNGKLMAPFHAALVADLEAQGAAAAQAVAAGKAAITSTDGKTWVDDGKGVLQPTAPSAGAAKALPPSTVEAIFDAKSAEFGGGIEYGVKSVGGKYAALINAAEAGDLDGVKAVTMNGAYGKSLQQDIISAMTGATTVAAPAPTAAPTALYPSNLTAIWTPIKEKYGISSDVADYFAPGTSGPVKAMFEAALKGDVAGIKATTVNTAASTEVKAALLSALGAAPAAAPPQARAAKPVVSTPQPVPQPAPKVPTGAPPDFDALKVTTGNASNMATFNNKLATIKAAFEAGDENAILAMKFGVNTPNKQAAKVANDALAALGSVHKVQAGQDGNSHPALTGGTAQAPAAKPSAPAQPKPKADLSDTSWVKLSGGEKIVEVKEQFGVKSAIIEVAAKGYDATAFGAPPDFFTIGSQGPTGKWSSSKQEVNDANNAAVQEIFNAATKNGTPEKLAAMKFPLVVNGQVQMVGIEDHKAAQVKEYFKATLAELEAQLKPTYKTQTSGSMVGSYNSATRSIASSFKKKSYPEFKAHAQKAADYLVLSKDAAASVPVPAKGQFSEMKPGKQVYDDFRKTSEASYNALNSKEQAAVRSYTGDAYKKWNYQLRTGDYDGLPPAGKEMVKAFEKVSQEVPEGTILWRGIGVGLDTYKSVVGGLLQDGSFNSSSYGSNPAFKFEPTWLRIHVTKGVKGLDATQFSNYGAGEREIIIQNNVRYLVVKAEHHKNFVDSDGTSWGSKNIVDVIALPHED